MQALSSSFERSFLSSPVLLPSSQFTAAGGFIKFTVSSLSDAHE